MYASVCRLDRQRDAEGGRDGLLLLCLVFLWQSLHLHRWGVSWSGRRSATERALQRNEALAQKPEVWASPQETQLDVGREVAAYVIDETNSGAVEERPAANSIGELGRLWDRVAVRVPDVVSFRVHDALVGVRVRHAIGVGIGRRIGEAVLATAQTSRELELRIASAQV